jgi:DNA polymerase-3 subunit gamma/tau
MFENIIGLDPIVTDLRRDIAAATLPRSLLLAGPRYGGKGSLALELARVLTCREDGRWGCACRSCTLQRSLQHHDTIMVGDRYFDLEIAASVDAFVREPRPGTAYLLLRAVRKLIRRFDPMLLPESRAKKAETLVATVEELIQQIEPTDGEPEPWHRLKESVFRSFPGALGDSVEKLQAQLPHDPVPVDLVRAIASWAHVSSAGGAKVVIIEEAHQLQDAARNAMLKVLEEPPPDVSLILTSSRRTAIIPTLLSRLRVYPVPERTPHAQKEVLERIFRVPVADQAPLGEFFRHRNAAARTWRDLAATIIVTLPEPDGLARLLPLIREQFATASPRKGAEYLFDALLEELRDALRSEESPAYRRGVTAMSEAIRSHWDRIATRNMNPLSVVESLLVTLRGYAIGEGIEGDR